MAQLATMWELVTVLLTRSDMATPEVSLVVIRLTFLGPYLIFNDFYPVILKILIDIIRNSSKSE